MMLDQPSSPFIPWGALPTGELPLAQMARAATPGLQLPAGVSVGACATSPDVTAVWRVPPPSVDSRKT